MMKEIEFSKMDLSVFFSVICFLISVYILIEKGADNFNGWFIMAISFGYLLTFSERKSSHRRQKLILNILSFAVPVIVLIYGLLFNLL